ncbi:MAG: DpnI domain-containing protein [Candidatus Cybelea sp.]
MQKTITWKELLHNVVSTMPRYFMLADVLKYRARFEQHFPNNRFVDAKIRQSLQVLRDQGFLRFVRPGQYERTDITPVFSPMLDFSAAAPLVSSAQIARITLETWASFNLYCLDCASDALDPLPNNTPVADFKCFVCGRTYQLKAKDGRFGLRITGAAYEPTIDYIRRGEMPEHIFVEFDKRFNTVVFVDAIPGRLITADRIIPRKPLAATARRAGWRGCNIVISGLPSVRMVAPAGIERSIVREEWKAL